MGVNFELLDSVRLNFYQEGLLFNIVNFLFKTLHFFTPKYNSLHTENGIFD